MEFINAIRELGLSKKKGQNDDLFVDRLNHRYTVVILILFAVVVTASQYGGKPIECWVPGHFTGNYESYASNICWVSSTYNIPLDEDIPHSENDRKVKMLKYYQWTPFILLFQALLFYFPRMIWRSLNDKSGLNLQGIVSAVHDYQKDTSKYTNRENFLNFLTNTFDQYVSNVNDEYYSFTKQKNVNNSDGMHHDENQLTDQEEEDIYETEDKFPQKSKLKKFTESVKNVFHVLCITKGKRNGNYLLVLFVFCRVLFTLNSIVQLFILNHFLGNNYLLLGFEVINKIYNGDDWTQLKRFPRVTMCDFKIREVGIVHRYTVQCVLSINLFNEKIFIFIWFWLCLVSFFNFFDLISWTYTLVVNSHERYMYVKKRLTALKSPHQPDPDDKKLLNNFVNDYLKEDGVLALRLLSRNAHDLIVSEVVASLFNLYKSKSNQVQLQPTRYRKKRPIHTINTDEENERYMNSKSSKNEQPSSTSIFISKNQLKNQGQ